MSSLGLRFWSFIALACSVGAGGLAGRAGIEWVDWTVVDVLLVVFAGAGFFTITREAARLVPANRLPRAEMKAQAWLEDAVQTVASGLPDAICIEFKRSAVSPPNFEETKRQHQLACPWAKETADKICALSAKDLPELDEQFVGPLPADVTDPYINRLRQELCDDVKTYAELRNSVLALRRTIERTGVEDFFVLLAPFFVSIAVGLSLFKALYDTG